MNALVCLTERLMEETWSACGDGNREPLLCALFDAIDTITGECKAREPEEEEEEEEEEEGRQHQPFMFNAEEEHCLRCCMEALEAVGRDGGWSDGSILINQGRVNAVGKILSSCTTPSTRRWVSVYENMLCGSSIYWRLEAELFVLCLFHYFSLLNVLLHEYIIYY